MLFIKFNDLSIKINIIHDKLRKKEKKLININILSYHPMINLL